MNQTSDNIPESLAKIVDQVIGELSLEDRATIANLEEDDIEIINTLMTDYIQSKLSEWSIQYKEADLTEPETINE